MTKKGPYGTAGGNGGYTNRKKMDDGLDKPMKKTIGAKSTIGGSAKPSPKK